MSKALLPPGSIHGSDPVPSLSPSPSILQTACLAHRLRSVPLLLPHIPCPCLHLLLHAHGSVLGSPHHPGPWDTCVPLCPLSVRPVPTCSHDEAGTSLQQGAESFQGTARSTDARGECTIHSGDGPLCVTNARRAEGCCTPPELHVSLHAPRTTQLCPSAGWKLSVPSPWGRRLWHLHSSSRMGQSVGAASSPLIHPNGDAIDGKEGRGPGEPKTMAQRGSVSSHGACSAALERGPMRLDGTSGCQGLSWRERSRAECCDPYRRPLSSLE